MRKSLKPQRAHEDEGGRWYWKPEKKLRPNWKTTPLGKDQGRAFDEARRLNRLAEAWFKEHGHKAQRPKVRSGPKTVGQLIALYKQPTNPKWAGLAATTRVQYTYEFTVLEDEFGHELAGTIDEVRVDEWAERLTLTAPETLRHVASRGRTLFKWAGRKKMIARGFNPFVGIGLGAGNKRKFRFLVEDLRHVLKTAAEAGVPSIGVALVIAFATVQRISDVLTFDDTIVVPQGIGERARLAFVQSKTGKEIDMLMPELVADVLAAYPPKPVRAEEGATRNVRHWIVSEETGEPYHHKTAARVFARVLAKAIEADPQKWKHLAGGQLRDGRRSGFVHRVAGGATVELTCSISGHSIEEGYDIVEHYLPRTKELADAADKFMTVRL